MGVDEKTLADIRNKLTPPLNLCTMIKNLPLPLTENSSLNNMILKEVKQTEISIKYLSNLKLEENSSQDDSDKLILLKRINPEEYEIHRGEIRQTKNLIMTTKDKKLAERIVDGYNL